jgi:hypothetical protein
MSMIIIGVIDGVFGESDLSILLFFTCYIIGSEIQFWTTAQ